MIVARFSTGKTDQAEQTREAPQAGVVATVIICICSQSSS